METEQKPKKCERVEHGKCDWVEHEINIANKEYLGDEPFQDIPDLSAKLEKLKDLFIRHDSDKNGEIDYGNLHEMAQSIDILLTDMELKKRVHEITGNTSNSLSYKDCAMTFLGRRSTMCQRIMKYSGKNYLEKQSCLLEIKRTTLHTSNLVINVPSAFPSTTILFPSPPPPTSPADIAAGTNTYPAA
ncbi:allograft inflammatory factor 1-like [Discoglossus pictus]